MQGIQEKYPRQLEHRVNTEALQRFELSGWAMSDSVGLVKELSIFQERVREQQKIARVRNGSFGIATQRFLLLLGFSSAGLSDHQLATEQNISGGKIRISDSIEHNR
jgi:hypothetical protein